MSFYNTGNPVPSIDPRDLDDNAKHIDELANSTLPTFVDRLGVTRRTLFGIESDADAILLRSDLASTAAAKGASIVGRAWQAANSVAQLKTLSTSGPSRFAETTGYYAAGDGGAGIYYVPASFVGLVDNGGSVLQASDGGFWLLNHDGEVNVRQYGAKSDGTDGTARIQSALSDAAVKVVTVPVGKFTVDKLVISRAVTLQGACRTNSIIETTTVSGDGLEISTGTSNLTGTTVRSLILHTAVTKTGGFAINQTSGNNGALYLGVISDVVISGNQLNGVGLKSTVWCTIADVTVKKVGLSGTGLLFRGGPVGNSASNCMISKFRVLEGSGGAGSSGIWIDSYSEGNYFTQCTAESPTLEFGLKMTDTLVTVDTVKNHFFDQLICDANSITALNIMAGRTLNFTNCWFCTTQIGDGVALANCFDVGFEGCTIANNFKNGVNIQNTAMDVTFNGCTIAANSIIGVNQYSGITANFNTNDLVITNNKFARKRGSASNHKYSVEILGGTSQGYIIANNNMRGWNTAVILDGGATSNKVIGPNTTV